MRLLWLADVLRSAGLTVHEVEGWERRGSDTYGPVRGITCHATAGSRTSTDAGEIRVLLEGSETAPPPIAQLYLSRTGHWWVVASGTCYHSRVGWDGPNEGYGNDSLLGIEAQHSNTAAEPWTDVQYRSYVRGVAALVRHRAYGYDVTVTRVAGHKEHQPGAKSDPTFDMDRFRVDVRAAIEEGDMPTVRDIWLSGEADLIQRYNPDGSPVTSGNIKMTAGYALGYAAREVAGARRDIAAVRVEMAALRSVVESLADTLRAGGGSVDTAAILAGVDLRVTAAITEVADELADRLAG